METKHTPAPWRKSFTIEGSKMAVRCDGHVICSLYPPSQYTGQDERYEQEMKAYEADQNLIAAAPEPLEALQWLYNTIDSCVELTPEVLLNAKTAINKATNP